MLVYLQVSSKKKKRFCSHKSFDKLFNLFEGLIESCAKYCDHLETNFDVRYYQSQDDIQRDKTVNDDDDDELFLWYG